MLSREGHGSSHRVRGGGCLKGQCICLLEPQALLIASVRCVPHTSECPLLVDTSCAPHSLLSPVTGRISADPSLNLHIQPQVQNSSLLTRWFLPGKALWQLTKFRETFVSLPLDNKGFSSRWHLEEMLSSSGHHRLLPQCPPLSPPKVRMVVRRHYGFSSRP